MEGTEAELSESSTTMTTSGGGADTSDSPRTPSWASVVGTHLALTALMTWPAVLVAHHDLLGITRGDKFQFIWNFWWMKHALLDLQQLPFFTELQYYPTGVSLALHDMAWFWSLLSVPLQLVFDPRFVLNLFLLSCFPLNGLAFFKMASELTRDRSAALAGSVVFAFSPYLLGRFGVSHVQYLGAFFIPLFVLSLWRYRRNPRAVHLAAAGAWLALQSLITFYYGVAMACIAAVFLVVCAFDRRDRWRDEAFWRAFARQTAAFGITATLLLAPVLVPMLAQLSSEPASSDLRRTGQENIAYNSADLVAALVPDHTMAAWRGWSVTESNSRTRQRIDAALHGSRFERSIYPGWLAWVALAAVLASPALRRRNWPWTLLMLGGLIVALGPTLHVNGRAIVGAPMPAALFGALPVLDMLRSSTRFMVFGMLGAGMLVTALLAELRRRRGDRLAVRLAVLCIGIAVVEFLPRPISHFSYEAWLSPFYERLGEDSRDFAILNVPVDFRDPRGGADLYEYAQTVHHKPIIGGYVSREPESVFAPLEESPLLQALSHRVYEDDPRLSLDDAARVDMRGSLRELGVGSVLVHRRLLSRDEWQRVNGWLESGLGEASFEDEWIRAYTVGEP